MNTISKFLVLYLSVSCISGERVYGIDATNAHRVIDVTLKIGMLATLFWGVHNVTTTLSDIRDILLEQLMNNLCSNGSCLPSDTVNLSYTQEISEHIDGQQLQHDMHVYNDVSLSVPQECIHFCEVYDAVEDTEDDEEGEADTEDEFEDEE